MSKQHRQKQTAAPQQGDEHGAELGIETYGDWDAGEWVYVMRPRDAGDRAMVRRINRLCASIRTEHQEKIVSWPQVLELAARYAALVDWSTLREDADGGYVEALADKRYTVLMLDAYALGIPPQLVARTAVENHGKEAQPTA